MRSLLCVVVLAVAVSVTAAPVPKGGRPGGDWPQWRGPNRDGISTAKGLLEKWPADGPKLLWNLEAPDAIGIGYGSVAISNGRAFVLGAEPENKTPDEFCTCLHAKDGGKIWRTNLGAIGRATDNWGGGPRSTPTVDGDRVYALGSTGELVCLSADKGEVVWRKNLPTDFKGVRPSFGYSESPLVDGDVVVVTPGGAGGMVALDKATGKTVWQCNGFADGAAYSSIVVAEVGGVRQFVAQTAASGIGVRAKDGQLLWRVAEMVRGVQVIPTPVVADGHVFFTASAKSGCECYRLEKDGDGTKATKVYTKNLVVANSQGGVVALGDKVYGHTDTGAEWVCFPFKTGGEAATWKHKGVGKGSIVYADYHFYCYGETDGTCALVAAGDKEYAEVGRFKLPANSKLRPASGKVWAHPSIAGGRLFLRDYEKLFVYDIAK